MKRGQVTIFLIIGIIILASFVILLSIDLEKNKYSDLDTRAVEDYIETMLKQSAIESIKEVLLQGGKSAPSFYVQKNIEGKNTRVAYVVSSGSNMIDKASIENEICKNIMSGLEFDLNFDSSFDYSTGEMACNLNLAEKTTIELNFPINITRQDTTKRLEHFTTEVDVNLGQVMNAAEFFAEKINSGDDLSELDLSCERIKVCTESNIVKVLSYTPWEDYAGVKFYYATDRNLGNTCTKLERINNGNC